MNRRFFLMIAAGMLAIVAGSVPARASSVLYTVAADVIVISGTTTGATVVFNEPVSGPVTVTTTTLPPTVVGTAGTPGPDDITFSFGSVGPGTYTLDFTVAAPSSPLLMGLGGTVERSTRRLRWGHCFGGERHPRTGLDGPSGYRHVRLPGVLPLLQADCTRLMKTHAR